VGKPVPLVYIGQSAQKQGVLGRLVQHISVGGTLLSRVQKAGVIAIEDITVIAVDLSKYQIFNGLHSLNRDALELNINRSMKAMGCKATVPFEVISYVSNSSRAFDGDIQRIADDVTAFICDEMPFFHEFTNAGAP
jgi:hypothetical protein